MQSRSFISTNTAQHVQLSDCGNYEQDWGIEQRYNSLLQTVNTMNDKKFEIFPNFFCLQILQYKIRSSDRCIVYCIFACKQIKKAFELLCTIVFFVYCNRLTLQYQIKFFIILAVLRRSVSRVGAAHLRVIAPGQHCTFFEEYIRMNFSHFLSSNFQFSAEMVTSNYRI